MIDWMMGSWSEMLCVRSEFDVLREVKFGKKGDVCLDGIGSGRA